MSNGSTVMVPAADADAARERPLSLDPQTIHVLWMTAGLGCDGESLAMTSATSPSLENLLSGVIPDSPRVVLHNPMLAYENGAEFLQAWYDAEDGPLCNVPQRGWVNGVGGCPNVEGICIGCTMPGFPDMLKFEQEPPWRAPATDPPIDAPGRRPR